MPDKNPVCVQCGVDRNTIRSKEYICATVDPSTEDGMGEVNAEWPRHRFKPWTKKELAEQAADDLAYAKHMGDMAEWMEKNAN